MRFLLAVLLLAQSVFTYPPGRSTVSTYPQQPDGVPCLATNIPSPVFGRNVALSTGYPLLAKYVVHPTDFWDDPPNTATEAVIDPDGNFPPVGTYEPTGTASVTFTLTGGYFPTLGYRNCFGGDSLSFSAVVSDGGWSPGDPEPVVFGTMIYELQADPDPFATIAGAVITSGGATNVAVWLDAVDVGTLLYDGTVAGLDTATFQLNCPADVKLIYYVFTNGVASTTVEGALFIQDSISVCGGA